MENTKDLVSRAEQPQGGRQRRAAREWGVWVGVKLGQTGRPGRLQGVRHRFELCLELLISLR